jgi:hypothetical protein
MKKALLIFAVLCTQVASAQDITSALSVYYPFNGNANDASGNSINGTVRGAALTNDASGKSNSAYYFNGTDSYIEVPNNAKFNPFKITYSVWVKFEKGSLNIFYPILMKGKLSDTTGLQYSLTVIPNQDFIPDTVYNAFKTADCNRFYYETELNDIEYRNPFAFDKWYHLAVSYESGVQKMYLNGDLVNQNAGINNKQFVVCSSPFIIGAHPAVVEVSGSQNLAIGNVFFQGSIDELRIYDRVLTTGDVKKLYETVTGLENTSYQPLNQLVYPNPSQEGKFYLSDKIQHIKQAIVTDLSGKQVSDARFNGEYLEMSNAPSGIYTLCITTEDLVYVGKIRK